MDKVAIKSLLIEYKSNGNKQALEQLMLLTYKSLYSLAYTYLKDQMLAEDVVSDTFIKLIEKVHTIKNEQNLTGYLRTIVINKCFDTIRKRKKEFFVDEQAIEVRPANTLTSSDTKNVRIALSQLSKVEREILLLWQYDYTLKQISEKTGFTMSQVRLLLQKAKEKFATKYHKNKSDETL